MNNQAIAMQIKKNICCSYEMKISGYAEVYVDDYKNGEGENRNQYEYSNVSFSLNDEDLVFGIKEKFEKYIERELFCDSNDVDLSDSLENDCIIIPVTVDVNNEIPSEDDIEKWKKGEIELFVQYNYIYISVNGVNLKSPTLQSIFAEELQVA